MFLRSSVNGPRRFCDFGEEVLAVKVPWVSGLADDSLVGTEWESLKLSFVMRCFRKVVCFLRPSSGLA